MSDLRSNSHTSKMSAINNKMTVDQPRVGADLQLLGRLCDFGEDFAEVPKPRSPSLVQESPARVPAEVAKPRSPSKPNLTPQIRKSYRKLKP